jgi:uncharacterized membrane protein
VSAGAELRLRNVQHLSSAGLEQREGECWRRVLIKMSPALFLTTAFIVGFATGLRTFTPLALICWVAVWGWLPLGSSRLHFLGTNTGATIVSILAAIELIGDKLPKTPDRITTGPLGARTLIASFAAAALAVGMGQSWIAAVICGAIASVIGAFAGFRYRTWITKQFALPDWLFAATEDAVTLGLTLVAFRFLLGTA